MKKVAIILSVLLAFASTNLAMAYSMPNGGKILFIGDSYCTGANVSGDGKEYPDAGWAQVLAYGMQLPEDGFAQNCYGGTGIAAEYENKNFQSLIEEHATIANDKDKVRWVIVVGGYNDHKYSYDEIMIKGESLAKKTKELYPEAELVLGMVGWDEKNTDIQDKLMNVVSPAYRDLADYLEKEKIIDVHYLDKSETALIVEEGEVDEEGKEIVLLSEDKFHPNYNGQNKIATAVADYLLDIIIASGSDVVKPDPLPITPEQYIPPLIMVAIAILVGATFGIRLVIEKKKQLAE